MTIGDKFRLGREALGMSKEELAEKLGLDPGTVRAWERWPDKRQNHRSIPVIAKIIGADPFSPPSSDADRAKRCRLLLGQFGQRLDKREAVVLEWECGRRRIPKTILAELEKPLEEIVNRS
jgi:DNA-binding transcriptional regulator YiaG